MAHEVDLAAFNIHEIVPPGNVTNIDYTTTDIIGQTASAETLAERAEYEESTGIQHQDYVSEMIDIGSEGELTSETPTGSEHGIEEVALDISTSSETGGILKPKQ